jgi:hypothetical protein
MQTRRRPTLATTVRTPDGGLEKISEFDDNGKGIEAKVWRLGSNDWAWFLASDLVVV